MEAEVEANESPKTAITAITVSIRHHSTATLFFFSLCTTLAPPLQRDLFSSLGSPPKLSPVLPSNQNPSPSSTSAEPRGAAARSSHPLSSSLLLIAVALSPSPLLPPIPFLLFNVFLIRGIFEIKI
ncbi:uncharacterized protein DS421_2g59510 [Arachis hypogaea]|nr:uncharacterized protein DS421_2g59510 [Arachis hypogaea]